MMYRDPLAGLRSQVVVKCAVLVDRERTLTPVLRALQPAADAALDGLLAAHHAAQQQSTRLRRGALG